MCGTLRDVFIPGTYFAVVWLIYVAVYWFFMMCAGMWGLCADYSRSAVGHICTL